LLEKLRMKEKLNYSIEISPDIDPEATYIPPMVLQPYVENAIKHGIANKTSAGTIKIEINKNGKNLFCLIEDNGTGRKASTKHQDDPSHKSLGTQLTSERFDLINKQGEGKIFHNITDLLDENGKGLGTRVELNIPYEED